MAHILKKLSRTKYRWTSLGCGGGLVDRAADSGLYDPSSIPIVEKKDNKQKEAGGWPIQKKRYTSLKDPIKDENRK